MTATVKISELTASAGITAGDVFVSVTGGPGNYTTRKVTAAQLAAHVTSSITELNVTSVSASNIVGKLNGLATSVSTVSTNTSLNTSQYVVLANAEAGNITLTLPDASTAANAHYAIKKIDSTSNIVTISGSNSQTLDGEMFKQITTQYEAFFIVSNGSNWFVF